MIRAEQTIVALATPPGQGALAVIRVSGPQAIAITASVFKGKALTEQPSHTIHYGHIVAGDSVVDEVMISLFRAPRSFTAEDTTEISCHGSPFIAQQIIALLIRQGAMAAQPGEFTMRAFLHGRIDLSQAEAVADVIQAQSDAALKLALDQMKGGFARQIKALRQQLIDYKALIELELDFGEEDVAFADREKMMGLMNELQAVIRPLAASFASGQVIREGLQTVLAGKPNAGKSTLLNALLQDERALVSDIAGTTRDTIEESLHIDGLLFRFIDTAGLRESTDLIEQMGISRTRERIRQAHLLVLLFDLEQSRVEDIRQQLEEADMGERPVLLVGNKADRLSAEACEEKIKGIKQLGHNVLGISALRGEGIDALRQALVEAGQREWKPAEGGVVISNMRHYEALLRADRALEEVREGLEGSATGEILSLSLREALEALGEISGQISNEEVLGSIFGRFCIGK